MEQHFLSWVIFNLQDGHLGQSYTGNVLILLCLHYSNTSTKELYILQREI